MRVNESREKKKKNCFLVKRQGKGIVLVYLFVLSDEGGSHGKPVCVARVRFVCCMNVCVRARTYVIYIGDVNKRAKWSRARDKRNTRPLPIGDDALVFDRARAGGRGGR